MSDPLDTKTKILDAAERLFGSNGFESTSLRDITTAAGVNLAAVNYHFQSKDHLIDAVVARRLQPVNARRIQLLDALGPDPSVRQIWEAFIRPVLELDKIPLAPLIGRVMTNPDLFVDRIFNTHLAPVVKRFHEALSVALPHLPPEEVVWRFHFSIGVMTHLLMWGGMINRISGGLCSMQDREALLERVLVYATAGFECPAPKVSSMSLAQ